MSMFTLLLFLLFGCGGIYAASRLRDEETRHSARVSVTCDAHVRVSACHQRPEMREEETPQSVAGDRFARFADVVCLCVRGCNQCLIREKRLRVFVVWTDVCLTCR